MTIASLAGLPPRPVIRNTDKLIVSDRNCGVEIEIENINQKNVMDKTRGAWDPTEDHSLRPRGASLEIRTSKGGLCGKALTDSFDMLPALKLEEKGGRHFSWRTGLHCHVDVRDRVPEDLRVMATKYALIEPFIFQWAGNGRHESRFSMPWWVVSRDVTRISEMMQTTGTHDFVNTMSHFSKYTALNLAPTVRLGTIEFRHGQSTCHVPTILDYVNICLSLVETSVSNGSPTQCSDLVAYYMNEGPLQFMRAHLHPQVAGLLATQTTGKRPLTNAILQLALETAMDIAELGMKASMVSVPTSLVDSLELVIMNRDTSARRSLDRAIGIIDRAVGIEAVQIAPLHDGIQATQARARPTTGVTQRPRPTPRPRTRDV